jgi:hypothetical protein
MHHKKKKQTKVADAAAAPLQMKRLLHFVHGLQKHVLDVKLWLTA